MEHQVTHSKWNQRGTICYLVPAYVKRLRAVIFMPESCIYY